MVIKLRRFSRSRILKTLSFALVVILFVLALLKLFEINNRHLDFEALFVEDYSQSESYSREVSWAIHEITNQMFNENSNVLLEPEFLYYISDGEKVFNNAPLTKILEYEKYQYQYLGQGWEYSDNTYREVQNFVDEDFTLYLAFTEEIMQVRQEGWEKNRSEIIPLLVTIIASILIAILCIIYLIAVTGRKPDDNELHLSPYMDRIYSDIQLGVLLLILFVSPIAMVYRYDRNVIIENVIGMNQRVTMIVSAIVTGIATIISGLILLSLARKIKARKFLKHSLIYTILAGISDFIKSFFDYRRFERYPLTKALNRRQIIFTVSSGAMVFMSMVFIVATGSFIMGMLPVFIEGVIIFWFFYENRRTYEEINHGFQESIQEQMKSERMKVDLITNVSHDLKTPLTSIISYVDLLSKEDLPESAKDFVSILADKSERLKNIVSDLFDLAKSTSGNLPLNMEEIDLKRLIEQTLGDMEDEIKKSDIRIKTSLTETPVYIYSDGKKLYRVFQNIIGNAIKYSLQGTRVFIDMDVENRNIIVTVKNTASYDMNFSAEEILQRFNRGDESRTTEGSGLGLSIAESFTWACGGTFKVDIDGDQFKIKLEFPVVNPVMQVTE